MYSTSHLLVYDQHELLTALEQSAVASLLWK